MAAVGMVGIDTSKGKLDTVCLEAGTRKQLWEKSFPNTPQGIRQLLEKTPAGVHWVIEPTGRYSIEAAKQAQQAGQVVLLAPPRKAKAFLKSLQDRAKTDRLDARGLALFGLSRDVSEPLRPYPVKKEVVEQVSQLLSARRGLSRARSSLRLQAEELEYAQPWLCASLKALDEQIVQLDKQIVLMVREHEEFAAAPELDKVPGIGSVTAAAVTACLASKTFTRSDEFVAYVGLDVGVVQSGKRKGDRGLTHQGHAELRRLLYLCAQSSLRANGSPFRTQYEREQAKGMTKTAAICAMARKMARLCWSLHAHGTKYDPGRVYQQPKKPPTE